MRAQDFGQAAAIQARLLSDLLEEAGHALRVVAGVGHRLDADAVGLVFMRARVADLPLVAHRLPQGQGADDHVGVRRAGDDRRDHTEPSGDIGDLGVLGGARQMALGDVRELVPHDAGDLALAVGGDQQAAVEADEAAGHRECIDAGVVDDEEGQLGRARGAVRGELPAHRRDVVGQLRVFEDVPTAVELPHDAGAQRLLLHRRQGVVGGLADVRQVDRRRRDRLCGGPADQRERQQRGQEQSGHGA
nr:hypothetical protein [Sinimarinibacterium flocculans]